MEFQVELTRSAEQLIPHPKKLDNFFMANQEPNIELSLPLEKKLYTFFMYVTALNRQSLLIHSILSKSKNLAKPLVPNQQTLGETALMKIAMLDRGNTQVNSDRRPTQTPAMPRSNLPPSAP